jgi:tRNA G18 (ribose-2'-O)-methylase SpoU
MAGPRVRPAADAGDPRLHDFVALTDVALRSRAEPEGGLFVAEGEKVIRRALAAGCTPRQVVVTERWLASVVAWLDGVDVDVAVVTDELAESVTGYRVHRGALASFQRPSERMPGEVLAGARTVAVLEDVNDHANVGAVFRAAAGLGVDGVLLSPRSADPLYRRAIKVSMGTVLSLPWARLAPWPRALDDVRAAGFRVLALTPAEDALPIGDLSPADLARCAVLLGSEGDGLTDRSMVRADVRVRIPMSRGTDSLNVGSAAAVAFYAVTSASGAS